jgi:hypothetical protein
MKYSLLRLLKEIWAYNMEEISKEIMICLIAAHFVGDFLLQSDTDASEKKRIPVVLKHGIIVTALTYLFCGIWDLWQIPVIIFLTHNLLDYIKMRLGKRSATTFLMDQALHIVVIIAIIIAINLNAIPVKKSPFWVDLSDKFFLELLILMTGVIVSIKAGGILIELAVKPFTDQMKKEDLIKGFEKGGKVIGYLERSLIFLFIFIGQPMGVGLLITAKSILRFGEIKDRENRMEAEYIIIGTLMSFGYGMFIAYLTKFFLDSL